MDHFTETAAWHETNCARVVFLWVQGLGAGREVGELKSNTNETPLHRNSLSLVCANKGSGLRKQVGLNFITTLKANHNLVL